MPAYREKVYIIPSENSQPVGILEFPFWWDRNAFFEKFGHRMIDTGNPFFVDYGLLITGREAIEWDEQCHEQFADDPRARQNYYQESSQTIDTILKAASWIVVESYEWESGLS